MPTLNINRESSVKTLGANLQEVLIPEHLFAKLKKMKGE